MADKVVRHFEQLFSGEQNDNDVAIQHVLQQQDRHILSEECMVMEAPLALAELHTATEALAQGKVPDPNGIPLALFLKNWTTMGSTLLNAILDGIRKGQLHSRFTKGLLVLLAKRGDLHRLFNRRPLTLLNLIYKIVAKSF